MNDPSELYASVLERVNDGLDVDWESLEAQCPQLAQSPQFATRWRGLRQVQEISTAFRHVRETPEITVSPLPTDTADPPVQWGTLHLKEKIGEGSFGEVYRAHDPMLERDVALKLTRGADAHQRQRFLGEGRRLAQIDHPGVVRVYGADLHDGRAGVWMDLATGRSLDQRLEQDGRFAEIEALDIARQLASSLSAVHGGGLVHGDIKAANVLRRDGGEIVLGDFGSAIDLRLGDAAPASATPLSAAPEILRGEPAAARSDIYSLGVLLFNLLTNAFPFEGDTPAAIQTAHRQREPTRLRDLRPDISPGFAALVDRAVTVDPAERWPGARQLGDAVEALIQGSTGPPQRKPPSRVWAALLGATLAATLVGAAILAWPGPQTTSSHTEPPNVDLFRGGHEMALRTGDPVDLGDALHLRVDGNGAPLWLYLVNEDAQGRVYKLFPLTGVEPSNPLPTGDLRLPGRIDGVEQDWVVTSEGQTESFLVIASRQPLPELESALAEIEVASAHRTPGEVATFGLPTRGVGGLKASVEATAPGTLLTLREMALASSGNAEEPPAEITQPWIQIVTLRSGPEPRP